MDIRDKIVPIIPAAGYGQLWQGKSKLVTEICEGEKMIEVLIRAIYSAGMHKAVVILNPVFADQIRPFLPKDAIVVIQLQPLGTAPAVYQALPYVNKPHVMILFADMVLWRPKTLKEFAEFHLASGKKMSLMSIPKEKWQDEGPRHYGRIAKDGNGKILGIFEPEDDLPKETAIKDVNPSVFCFCKKELPMAISKITNLRKKGEKTINEAIYHFLENGGVAEYQLEDAKEARGVNNFEELIKARQIYRERQMTRSD